MTAKAGRPPITTPPERLAYLRLKGLAEGSDRVHRTLKMELVRPDAAVGMFLMRRGELVVGAFRNERHWVEQPREMDLALAAYGRLLSLITRP